MPATPSQMIARGQFPDVPLIIGWVSGEDTLMGPSPLPEATLDPRSPDSQAFKNAKNFGRGDWIRTSDPLRPRQVRYQAALRPD